MSGKMAENAVSESSTGVPTGLSPTSGSSQPPRSHNLSGPNEDLKNRTIGPEKMI